MPNDTTITEESTLQIPEETFQQFPELVGLIKQSQSMDDEERQYWVDVLPIMSEDQIKNLQDILANEKRQIEEVNNTYARGMGAAAEKAAIAFDEESYMQKKQARIEAEQISEKEETSKEEDVLKELENL